MSQTLSLVTHKHRVCDLHLIQTDKGELHRAYLKEGRRTVWRLIELHRAIKRMGPEEMHNIVTSSRPSCGKDFTTTCYCFQIV